MCFENLYLKTESRRGKATNEDEVIAASTLYGFKAYTIENLSFAKQVRLFSQAETVVPTHGTGLTNIIFAQNLTVVARFTRFICYS
ncbi:glycosyltransferase 61 family protein [Chroogloeocystis siderophila]|uniref:glycosyltransferase 61 family protein n=1 Tax=Chroogloeocystis siderophila TaxID=329163 RepID=UPI0009FC476F